MSADSFMRHGALETRVTTDTLSVLESATAAYFKQGDRCLRHCVTWEVQRLLILSCVHMGDNSCHYVDLPARSASWSPAQRGARAQGPRDGYQSVAPRLREHIDNSRYRVASRNHKSYAVTSSDGRGANKPSRCSAAHIDN